jgi:hypothetical protein
MRKTRLYLAVAFFLAVSSSVQAEVFWTTVGGFSPPTAVALLDPGAPPQSSVPITGLQPGEFSQGIALRPATHELYLLGSSGRLYRLNPVSGVATQIGLPLVPALAGTEFGVGFDNADHLRVVSNTGQNLRIDPTMAAVTVDTPLAFAPGDPNAGMTPQVGAIAFDPLHGGATGYAIDDQFGLLRLGSTTASDGVLTTIAAGTGPFAGFAISQETGAAYGIMQGFSSFLIALNLTTGATSEIATVGGQFATFRGLALAPASVSVPALSWQGLAALALGLALSGLLIQRRRRAPLPAPVREKKR